MAKGKGDAPPVPETPAMFKEPETFPLTGSPKQVWNDEPRDVVANKPPPNGTPARKPSVHTPLSGGLQAAAKIDRILNKMSLDAAIGTLEYLLGIYEAKAVTT